MSEPITITLQPAQRWSVFNALVAEKKALEDRIADDDKYNLRCVGNENRLATIESTLPMVAPASWKGSK